MLQLPGAEFGAFRWGYTVDPPLPGLTDKPLVTRDLLPLGSAAAMDLLYALDDRFQDGTLEPQSIAPIARLLGVDTVWADQRRRPSTGSAHPGRSSSPRSSTPATPGSAPPSPTASRGRTCRCCRWSTSSRSSDPRDRHAAAPGRARAGRRSQPIIRANRRRRRRGRERRRLVDAAAAGLLDGDELIVYAARSRRRGLLVTDRRGPALDRHRLEPRPGAPVARPQDVAGLTERAATRRASADVRQRRPPSRRVRTTIAPSQTTGRADRAGHGCARAPTASRSPTAPRTARRWPSTAIRRPRGGSPIVSMPPASPSS